MATIRFCENSVKISSVNATPKNGIMKDIVNMKNSFVTVAYFGTKVKKAANYYVRRYSIL